MKNLKLSVLALSLMTLGLGSCSKEACEVTPNTAQNASSDLRTFLDGSSLGFYSSTNEAITFTTATEDILIKGAFPGKDCGHVQLKRQIMNELNVLVDDPNFIAPANFDLAADGLGEYSFTVNHTGTGNGTYYYSAHYVSSGRNCDFRQGFVPQVSIEIKDNCSGFTLNASEARVNGNQVSFDLIVTNCTPNAVSYKLQGGLIAGSGNITVSNTIGYSSSAKNKNTVLTWNTTLQSGEQFTTTVTYTLPKAVTAGMNVSGNWSAKDIANIAPSALLPNIVVISNN